MNLDGEPPSVEGGDVGAEILRGMDQSARVVGRMAAAAPIGLKQRGRHRWGDAVEKDFREVRIDLIRPVGSPLFDVLELWPAPNLRCQVRSIFPGPI